MAFPREILSHEVTSPMTDEDAAAERWGALLAAEVTLFLFSKIPQRTRSLPPHRPRAPPPNGGHFSRPSGPPSAATKSPSWRAGASRKVKKLPSSVRRGRF